MRISELSEQTGVPVPTIKYYLREGLLPEGERTSATQAVYGEKHVERLRVIRALLDAGVSIAETPRVVAALDDPPASPHELLGTAHAANGVGFQIAAAALGQAFWPALLGLVASAHGLEWLARGLVVLAASVLVLNEALTARHRPSVQTG